MKKILAALLTGLLTAGAAIAADGGINAMYVNDDLSVPKMEAPYWKQAGTFNVTLMNQPMMAPRSKVTETENINVQAVNNGKWIAFRLSWQDSEKSEGGPLGKYSDGVALEFPVKIASDGTLPSPVMGEPGNPVHIFHWKSAFQFDKDRGRLKEIADIYPNASVDMYPLEPKRETRKQLIGVTENYPEATPLEKQVFVHGQAAGNPQSYPKLRGMDEIFAEGFGTSQVIPNQEGIADGKWENGRWTVVMARPLVTRGGSALKTGQDNFVSFAVWQGGKGETGSRKSLLLNWATLKISGRK